MRTLLAVYSLFSRFICRIKKGLYEAGVRKAKKAPLPVISVGNIRLGGTEKTPLAIELLSYFLNLGLRPALVSRGYKGKWEGRGGVLSDGKTISGTWQDAGDEPYMIARALPQAGVFIGKDRLASCQKAKSLGFDIVVLDDGFQHLRLRRDLDIVLHDLQEQTALREGWSAFKRADVLMLKSGSPDRGRQKIQESFPELPVFGYSVAVKGFCPLGEEEILPAAAWKGKNVLAFCGIARPERFYSLLERCGLTVAARISFSDHYAYPAQALEKILETAQKLRPEAVVTTDKDAVKVSDRREKFGSVPVIVLKIGLELPELFKEKVRAVSVKLMENHP
jgi:tetraacyldisaccharide 4'-kinase